MATVWHARDTASETDVAIKVLLPHLLDNEMVVERFKREIAAVRRIDHPGVVQIFDLIETDGLLALVLEYHGGLDLKRVIRRRGALPPSEVIELGAQVLDALGAAHEHGVIHRDVKPHNVLLDAEGRAKLTDFGLARVDDLVRVTTHTIAFGSPEYVAPELLGSDVIDPRADLYSLGVSLFEAATGKLPFRADSLLMLVKMHESGERPDLSAFGLPAPLAQTITRALAKDPDDRFPTADAMKRALAGESVGMVPRRSALCAKCGAVMVQGLPHCIECEHRPVRIAGATRAGRRVFIEPRRRLERNRDTLTFEQKARLMRLLRDMGGMDCLDETALDRRLKQIPVVVADRLSDEGASKLAEALDRESFDVSIGARGLLGWLQAGWRLRTSPFQLVFLYLFVFGPTLVLGAAATLGPAFEKLVGVAYVLGLFGVAGIKALISLGRAAPLVWFSGRAGLEKTDDPLALRASSLFARIRTSRLRNLLRRVLNRGFALDALPARALLERAMGEAERIDALEASIEAIDPGSIADRVQTLEEQIEACTDTYETNELIDEKHRLIGDLATLDERQEAAAQHYARLLHIASDLTAAGDLS